MHSYSGNDGSSKELYATSLKIDTEERDIKKLSKQLNILLTEIASKVLVLDNIFSAICYMYISYTADSHVSTAS